jgi:hypothetical protein
LKHDADLRVDEPMLSMAATRRNADKQSGVSVPKVRQTPLNSSILETRFRISGLMRSDLKLNMYPIKHQITPI